MQAVELGARVARTHGRGDAIAFAAQEARQQIADAAIVVDEEDVRRVVRGLGGGRTRGSRGDRHGHSFALAALKMVSSTLSGSSRSIIARRKRRTVSAPAGPISSSARSIRVVCSVASLATNASPLA